MQLQPYLFFTGECEYAKQFWGASFGMLTDRFGIEWMINAG